MKSRICIPDEPRFVHALALAVRPADTLLLLAEVGAVTPASLGAVRQLRETLLTLHDRASDTGDHENSNTALILFGALAEPDNQAYVAYALARDGSGAVGDALAAVGLARAESLRKQDESHAPHRPWLVDNWCAGLPTWRAKVARLMRVGGSKVESEPFVVIGRHNGNGRTSSSIPA